MSRVTLIGKLNAREGEEFVFEGTQEQCYSCSLRRTCGALVAGRRYRVVGLRDGRVQKCPLHEGGVNAVEVEETAIEAAVPSKKAVRGSRVSVSPPNGCTDDCEVWTICHPGGVDGRKLVIEDVVGSTKSDCPLGIDLQVVKLRGE
ncbi:MAG: hypothetical protein MAG715_00612 [Methanonatronarchaeales archaeon]|nr:hypothetical protein [Methanonatronarchaeales archaeon]